MKLPKIYVSDKEFEEGMKEYVNNIGEKGEPLVVPTKNKTYKKIGKLYKSIIKDKKLMKEFKQFKETE